MIAFNEVEERLRKVYSSESSCPLPRLDAETDWIPSILLDNKIHDPDYRIFGHFTDPEHVILDVGANYGYSAVSIWAAGSRAKVFSFEPIIGFEPFLSEIKRLKEHKYDFTISALGSTNSILKFAVPVVNGIMISAFTTAFPTPHFPSLATNLIEYVRSVLKTKSIKSLDIYRFETRGWRLDDYLANKEGIASDKIVAVKIDTEGSELNVLQGMEKLLQDISPLLLVECGWQENAKQYLNGLGYLPFSRFENKIILSSAEPTSANQIFAHRNRLSQYRALGLLS